MAHNRVGPLYTLTATIGAAGVAALVAPFLLGLIGGVSDGAGLLAGLGAEIAALFLAPGVFFLTWALAIGGGILLSFLRVRHILLFVLAGMLASVAAQRLIPFFLPIPRDQVQASNSLEVILSFAITGAIDGVIFWFLIRRFSKKAEQA
jgi:hypothetical protein